MVSRIAAGICLAILAGCTFPEAPLPPGERHLLVHAVLDPSRRVQMVSLSASDGSEINPGDLDDAVITITGSDGVPLTARQDAEREVYPEYLYRPPVYRIDLDEYGANLVPGGTYQLHITTSLGEVITGTTTIPEASPVAIPEGQPFDRLRDTLRLSWNGVPGARTYELQVWSSYRFGLPDYLILRYTRFAEAQVTLAGTARTLDDDPIFEEGAAVVTHLYAVDANYYDYYRALGDPFTGAPPSRLQGALGVFGSVVPIVSLRLAVGE